MDANTIKIKNTSRVVAVAVRIVQAILIFSVLLNGYLLAKALAAGAQHTGAGLIAAAIQNIATCAVALAALFIVSALLRAVQLEHTPFTRNNVARLKAAAVLVLAIEPLRLALTFLGNALRPISPEGVKTQVHGTIGGMAIVLGLVIFAVALMFEYGGQLQKQADETL